MSYEVPGGAPDLEHRRLQGQTNRARNDIQVTIVYDMSECGVVVQNMQNPLEITCASYIAMSISIMLLVSDVFVAV